MYNTFTNSSLIPILEAYRYICEDAEGKNINRAEKLIKTSHPDIIGRTLQDGSVISSPRRLTEIIRNEIPNSRKADCKFLQGVTRLVLDEFHDQNTFQSDCSDLNKMLKIIASPAHVNEYDFNLNNLSFEALKNKFMGAVQTDLENDKSAVANVNYQSVPNNKFNGYEIVRVPDFETAQQYGRYTSWCVTHYENMYDNYTKGGIGIFYFLLKNGFENVPDEVGEDAPFDEYGLSMIAISVNDDGSLNTCTTRWNHDAGGNDNSMDTQQISRLINANFYEVFKPRTKEEIAANSYKAVKDAFSGHYNSNFTRMENGTVEFLLDIDYLKDVVDKGRNSVSFDFIKDILTGNGISSFYSDSDIYWGDIDTKKFDSKLSQYGISFDDIRNIYDDDYDSIEVDISAYKIEEIKRILDEDFYNGSGMRTVYNVCCESGSVSEAERDVYEQFFDYLPFADKEYGLKYDSVKKSWTIKIVMSQSDCVDFSKEYDADGETAEMYLTENNDGIRISEPYGGWNGFDNEMWKEAIDSFADRVVEILSSKDKVQDKTGQQYFDFDKNYLDNPRNLPRR